MRVEASSQIFQMTFLGITAASTTTTALADIGYSEYAPYLLALGTLLSPAFAYAYVELGVFNRKNRERVDRGDNFVGPTMAIQAMTLSQAIGAAIDAQENGEDAEVAGREAAAKTLQELRDGIDIDEIEQ